MTTADTVMTALFVALIVIFVVFGLLGARRSAEFQRQLLEENEAARKSTEAATARSAAALERIASVLEQRKP